MPPITLKVRIIVGYSIFDCSSWLNPGKLKNWWNNATDEAYYAKTQCFIDLYNELEVEEIGMNVNGRLTLNENIADFGGVRSTHLTYGTL